MSLTLSYISFLQKKPEWVGIWCLSHNAAHGEVNGEAMISEWLIELKIFPLQKCNKAKAKLLYRIYFMASGIRNRIMLSLDLTHRNY